MGDIIKSEANKNKFFEKMNDKKTSSYKDESLNEIKNSLKDKKNAGVIEVITVEDSFTTKLKNKIINFFNKF